MTYKGRYKVINPHKYKGDASNVIYRSMWERHCFRWLDNNPQIKEWSSEEVVIPYFFDVDKSYHRYFVDLKYVTNEGVTFLIEIKPDKETKVPTGQRKTKRYITEAVTYVKNQCKWKAASEYAKDHGWHFQIWTEHTLQQMGIMTKPLKPLKPLKPYPKK